jgi:hypothetical protein
MRKGTVTMGKGTVTVGDQSFEAEWVGVPEPPDIEVYGCPYETTARVVSQSFTFDATSELLAMMAWGRGHEPHFCGRCGTVVDSAGAYVLHRCRERG